MSFPQEQIVTQEVNRKAIETLTLGDISGFAVLDLVFKKKLRPTDVIIIEEVEVKVHTFYRYPISVTSAYTNVYGEVLGGTSYTRYKEAKVNGSRVIRGKHLPELMARLIELGYMEMKHAEPADSEASGGE